MTKEVGVSKVFTKIRKANKRIIALEGSARSSKTISILQYIIMRCLGKTGMIVTIARERMTWVRSSVMIDFFWVLDEMFNLYDPKYHNKTNAEYRLNDNLIRFMGLDEPAKFKGAKHDIAWLNEALECKYAAFNQIAMRTTEEIILDWNPSVDEHWLFDKVITRDDCAYIHSTYKDNPFLDAHVVAEIEGYNPNIESNIRQGTADKYLWDVYGLGLRSKRRGLIFPKINIVKAMPEAVKCIKRGYGLDLGFNDPTAFIDSAFYDKQLWFDEVIYESGLITKIDHKQPEEPSVEGLFVENKVANSSNIWCENEPQTIKELQMCGYNVRKADKGPGSILAGIKLLKSYTINITENSLNFIKEAKTYKWKECPDTGKHLEEPVDAYNHCWDASRYWGVMELSTAKEKRKAHIPGKSVSDKFTTAADKIRYYENYNKHQKNFD